MPLSKRQFNYDAKLLGQFVSTVKDIKKLVEAKKPIPRISLKVDPTWCRLNDREAARRITALTDALIRTIAHCDAATHKTDAYRNERDSILEAMRAPKSNSH